MLGLRFLGELFGRVIEGGNAYSGLTENFGARGIDTSSLRQTQNTVFDLNRLLTLSNSFAQFLGFDQSLARRSVITAAADYRNLDLAGLLREPRGNAGDPGLVGTILNEADTHAPFVLVPRDLVRQQFTAAPVTSSIPLRDYLRASDWNRQAPGVRTYGLG